MGNITATAGMGDKEAAAKVDLGLLEEDDEFEEFPADETETKGEETTVNVWEDNWDDDKKEDDFANQLRSELQSHGSRMEHSPVSAVSGSDQSGARCGECSMCAP